MRNALLPSIVVLGVFAAMSASAESPKSASEHKVLEKYHAALPAPEDLTVYCLDWTPTLDAAKKKAASGQRPILLIVVTNSYGNLYTGHC